MEHFQIEENQQNRLLTHQDVLNTSSGNGEGAHDKNISFDHYKLNEKQKYYFIGNGKNTYKSVFHSLLPQVIKILLKLA